MVAFIERWHESILEKKTPLTGCKNLFRIVNVILNRLIILSRMKQGTNSSSIQICTAFFIMIVLL